MSPTTFVSSTVAHTKGWMMDQHNNMIGSDACDITESSQKLPYKVKIDSSSCRCIPRFKLLNMSTNRNYSDANYSIKINADIEIILINNSFIVNCM